MAAQLEAIFIQVVLDIEGGADGALRIVLVGDRRTEEGQHPVAEELGDRAVVAPDGCADDAVGAGDDLLPFFGVEALGDRGRADDIGEEDRDRFALAFQPGGGGVRLLVKRGFGLDGDRNRRDFEAALAAEFCLRFVRGSAFWAWNAERLPAALAEAGIGRVFGGTGRAAHPD